MTVNRSNYEIWLIDFLDGNLNELQEAELMLFLDENPDLKEELETVSSVHLDRTEAVFPYKDLLKKSVSDTADHNFEMLCVSHLEHDLDTRQEEELAEILESDPARKRQFDIFQKIRLTAPSLVYNNKASLKRSVIRPRHIYISIFSIAASIACLVYVFTLIPPIKQEPVMAELITDTASVIKVPPVHYLFRSENSESEAKTSPAPSETVKSVNTEIRKDTPDMAILPANLPVAGIIVNTPGSELIEFIPGQIFPEYEEKRSRIGKFIAKTYRDFILKEEKPSDMPLKGYEIAEGGINGINKLLGWNMAITRNTDRNGELRSVYFSSKLIKFNSPVKNQSQQ